jgi:hypothetical protein
VNPLRALLSALMPEADEHAARTHAVAVALKTLRADVHAMRRELAAVAARAEAVSRQVAQVRGLRQGSRDVAAMLDDLAALMDADRVRAHVRAAVDRAAFLDHPGPRLAIDALWPEDVYDVLTRAIPDPVFFEGMPAAGQTLRVPPRLAPVAAIATWTCVAGIVDREIVPAVTARFRSLLPASSGGALDIAPGRLVRREAGSSAPPMTTKAWQWGLVEIDLTRPTEAPATANTALAVFTPAAAHVAPAPGTGVRHTYEVWFGSKPA